MNNTINLNKLEKVAQWKISKSRKDFSNDELCWIFESIPYGLPFVLEDAKDIVQKMKRLVLSCYVSSIGLQVSKFVI